MNQELTKFIDFTIAVKSLIGKKIQENGMEN